MDDSGDLAGKLPDGGGSNLKPIEIIGGGLAGLSLGVALQRTGVPVTLYEAGRLPRHRVCGEFICGRGSAALEDLGLSKVLEASARHRRVLWSRNDTELFRCSLPEPALGLSRHRLDGRLACAFVEAGGRLLENRRHPDPQPADGRVLCTGRRLQASPWVGLKFHCLGLETRADLEMHLGCGGYLGLSKVEDGRTNVCALFRRRSEIRTKRTEAVPNYLRACGLVHQAARLEAASVDPESHAGVGGVQFSTRPSRRGTGIRLGDAYSVIPPFTGNGMSIALESAAVAFRPILAYAEGCLDWSLCEKRVARACAKRFDARLFWAGRLHPWLVSPIRQRSLGLIGRLHLLPFRLLYGLTH